MTDNRSEWEQADEMSFTPESGSSNTDLGKQLSQSDQPTPPWPAGPVPPTSDAPARAGSWPVRDPTEHPETQRIPERQEQRIPERQEQRPPERSEQPPPDGREAGERSPLGLSTAQVGASALAAVTSALAASFLGVAGTIIGAAFGSVVTTIAAALYTHSLRTAGERVRRSGSLIVQRIPVGSGQYPTALPGAALRHQEAQRTGRHDDSISRAMPLSAATTGAPGAKGAQGAGGAEDGSGATRPGGAGARGAGRAGEAGAGAGGRSTMWRRPAVVLAGLGLSGFLLAMGGITAAEGVLGHPVSGDSGGTTVGNVFGGSSAANTPDTPAPTRSGTTTPGPSASPTTHPSSTGTTTGGASTAPSSATSAPAQPVPAQPDGASSGAATGAGAGGGVSP